MIMTYKYPNNINDAKKVCKRICKAYDVDVSFDDAFNNFNNTYDACICTDRIECSKFRDWNCDLLIFSVLHEIGHIEISRNDSNNDKQKTIFAREFDAWHFASNAFLKLFKRNISIKQAKFMMKCLNSYIPDYNSVEMNMTNKDVITEVESTFWCPLRRKVNY